MSAILLINFFFNCKKIQYIEILLYFKLLIAKYKHWEDSNTTATRVHYIYSSKKFLLIKNFVTCRLQRDIEVPRQESQFGFVTNSVLVLVKSMSTAMYVLFLRVCIFYVISRIKVYLETL